jgi:hypothetical protein
MENAPKQGFRLFFFDGGNTLMEEAYRRYLIGEYWEGAEVYEIEPDGEYVYWPWGGNA